MAAIFVDPEHPPGTDYEPLPFATSPLRSASDRVRRASSWWLAFTELKLVTMDIQKKGRSGFSEMADGADIILCVATVSVFSGGQDDITLCVAI
ncbi:hypothetical protein EJB05_32508 [Eragrostis curvula]|uniref:Uncharacterized protein n=1 Tax=Eragrostis curvula TaxID=38414 RepID=A0A5J9UI04_9POAL|nr:hypothetical protein EJB05_32508 [Eragrostis curvula]